jgi:hypothetical protein
MLWGPYSPLKTGAYEATFSLSAAGARPDALIAVIEVIGGADVVFAREGVMGNQLRPGRLTEIDLSFATPGEMAVQTRVFYMGRGTLRSGPVVVQRIAPEGGPAARLRDWPLAFLWVGGTVLIGALFVQLMKLGGRRRQGRMTEARQVGMSAIAEPSGEADSPARRHLSRSWVSAQRERLIAVAALCGVYGIAALAYWWTRAPLYNPSGTIDPWLYTALFVNFDQFYDHFRTSYYASRLPWIVPGRIFYGVFPVDAAYWLLHGLAFVGGVSALFALVRRYVGLAAAVVGAATLALSPMYWNSQYWDYVDGITLTYLLAGLCFGLPLATGHLRAASLVAAGVFFAAAVTTNLFAGLVALIYPISYVFLQAPMGARRRLLAASKDLAALLVGAAALLVVLGLYARAYGGPFLYWKVQLDLIRSGAIELTQLPGNAWVRAEPRLLAPVFLIFVTAPLLALGRRLPPFRFAAGSATGLAFLVATLYTWQFLGGGNALELPYYFSYFSIPIALTTASLAGLAVSLVRSRPSVDTGLAATVTIAALVALGLIYRDERQGWTGATGMKISVALIVLAVLLLVGFILVRRAQIAPAACLAAVGAIAFAAHFAIDSSSGTFVSSYSAPENRNLYHAAMDEVSFVKGSSREGDSLPAFWYAAKNRTELISVQSMYYFGWTAIALELPTVTKELRERLALWNPQTMVMLCDRRDCEGGTAALRRAGFPYKEENAALISRGGIRFWSVFLRKAAGG